MISDVSAATLSVPVLEAVTMGKCEENKVSIAAFASEDCGARAYKNWIIMYFPNRFPRGELIGLSIFQ